MGQDMTVIYHFPLTEAEKKSNKSSEVGKVSPAVEEFLRYFRKLSQTDF